MDIQMPDEDGLAATRRIREVAPDTVVAVVTARHDPQWVVRAARAGASAFIPKDGSLAEMIDMLQRVGQRWPTWPNMLRQTEWTSHWGSTAGMTPPTARPSVLRVIDDGVGVDSGALDKRSEGHLGLRLLMDRVENLGGTSSVRAGPYGGTIVTAELPSTGIPGSEAVRKVRLGAHT